MSATFLFGMFIFLPSPAAGQVLHSAIRDELLAMEKADQDARTKCSEGPANEQARCLAGISQKIDEPNAKRLREIFDEIGFPNTAMVGRAGLNAIMMLLQHVPGIDLRERSLKPITRAFKNKEMPALAYANFVDRLLSQQGKKQLYGSNFDFKGDKLVMSPVKDPKKLAKRRASIGLAPLDEYVKELKELYRTEVVVPR